MSISDDEDWKIKSQVFNSQLDEIKRLRDALDEANRQLAVYSDNDNEKNAVTQKIIDMFAEKEATECRFIQEFQKLVVEFRRHDASYNAILNGLTQDGARKAFVHQYNQRSITLASDFGSKLVEYTNNFITNGSPILRSLYDLIAKIHEANEKQGLDRYYCFVEFLKEKKLM